MAQTSRTFRLFVSSTFTDLVAERNALQEQVFPRLRDLCLQHGCRFQAIDLRWGVSEEAALDQRTMPICLDEIARCQRVTPRPNFLVLLGDRYGWRPLPATIPAKEFAQIQQLVPSAHAHPLLETWYRRDDNAVPPVYGLQPRTGRFSDAQVWESQVERPLRNLLVEATAGMQLTPAERLKYLVSATEQEIAQGALHVSTAREQVFCCLRAITNLDQLIGSVQEQEQARQFIDLDEQGRLDQEARTRLDELKDRLSLALPGSVHTYEAAWTESGLSTDHLGTLPDTLEECLQLTEEDQAPSTLCVEVWRRLSRIILEEIARLEEADALEREITAHDAFGEARANPKYFTGRTAILHTMGAYVHSATRHPLGVFGASGSGKSALLARAVARLREEQPKAAMVVRFIGATPESSDGRALLESLCHQVARRYGADEASIPTDYPHLVETFPQQLALASAERPLIVVLDALDQLSDREGARRLTWLPAVLPEHVRLLVSTVPGDCLEALQGKLPAECLVSLPPMPVDEGAHVLKRWLADAGRTLQQQQRKQVLDAFGKNGLPLYLRLAFEEARRWASFTPAAETVLSKGIAGIIHQLFERLGRDENHGELLVARSLGYLAAAKYGLTEDELLDVLSRDPEVRADFKRRSPKSPEVDRLPVVVWSRLYFDLEPYLSERLADGTAVLSFYHHQLSEVVREQYLAGSEKAERHVVLARYFAAQPLQRTSAGKQFANLRKLSEQPYQETYGALWPELEATLCDLRFVEVKCAAERVYDLESDYDRALAALPEAHLPEVQKELEQVRKHQQEVADYTKHLIAYARAWSEARARHATDPARYPLPPPEAIPLIPLPTLASVRPWTDEKIRADTERIIRTPTRLDRLRAFAAFVRAESHHLIPFAMLPGFCLQQAYNYADAGPVVRAAEQLLQTDRRAALLLQPPTQRAAYTPHPALRRTLDHHSITVSSVSLTPDGQTAVSGSKDHSVRVWDLARGQCRHILQGHAGGVTSVSLTPDGQTAVSGSRDHTVRVWDLVGGQQLAVFPASYDVTSLSAIRTDGQFGFGTQSGQVVFVKLEYVRFGPPLMTVVRLWLPGTAVAKGHRDDQLSACCPHCGQRFVPPPDVLKTIHGLTAHLTPDQSPCLALPPEAWDEPGLSSQCPHCHRSVRFNPFVLDQRDRVWPALSQEVPAGPVPSPLPSETPEGKALANVGPPLSLPSGAPGGVVGGARSWLMSTLLWAPLIIAILGYCLGTLPTPLHFDRLFAWAALVGLILAWNGMGAMPTLHEQSPREEGLALAGVGALVAAGVLMVGLVGNPPIGLVGLGLVGVAVSVVTGVAGGIASPGVKHVTDMAAGLAVSTAAIGAFVTGSLVAGSLGGGLAGLVVGGIAGLVALVVGFLIAWRVAWLILKFIQVITQLGPAGGVLFGLVAGGILVWLGNVRVGEAVALVAGLAYSLAVGIASGMQKAPEAERFPRVGWGMRIAVVVSLLVLVWICLLGGWPIQVH